MVDFIISKTGLPEKGVQHTIALLNDACTIPFIARYRKEQTGNLDETQIEAILEFKNLFESIEKRRLFIKETLSAQQLLTPELLSKLEKAGDLNALEDLYLPFKKSKKTKAETARKNGLEPLAKIIMAQNATDLESIAQAYVKPNLDSNKALEGARHIIAEWINERTDLRDYIRYQLGRFATITSKVVASKQNEDEASKYKDYFDCHEALNRIPSHRLMALLRAEDQGFIKTKISIDSERALDKMQQKLIKTQSACSAQITLAIKDAYKRLLLPALTTEVLKNAKLKAETSAINVFSKNLKQLLLAPPIGEKNVLAIDPGFRTGCKIVCLDSQGQIKHNETIYPHPPKNQSSLAIKKISSLTEAYKIQAIAIGNGTASRETEQLVRRIRFKNDIEVYVVSEAGASVYSASKIAREEFPQYDVTVRGAISIGRRLQDPLAELVKIDPKSIGVGQYQHDVDQNALKQQLDRVTESCVNAVGVNLNTASASLLSFVSGIGPKIASNIIDYRKANGPFTSRKVLLKVPRLGQKAYEQGAGFLRIKVAKNPLDDSAVHPERYDLVTKIAKTQHTTVDQLIGNNTLINKIELERFCDDKVGMATLTDILNELEKPGLDIRSKAKVFTFNKNIKTIADLQLQQLLPGIVSNVTNFGAFVDIGIKENGLIHVSNLSDGFVSDVNAHISLHEQVIVKVIAVDSSRKRIQLKLHKRHA